MIEAIISLLALLAASFIANFYQLKSNQKLNKELDKTAAQIQAHNTYTESAQALQHEQNQEIRDAQKADRRDHFNTDW